MRRIHFPGRYESLVDISRIVVKAAKDAGLNEYEVYSVELAVDEACTNIIEHAYGGEDRGDIWLTCNPMADGLMIILEDTGRQFNPKKIPQPKVGAKLKDVKPRGAGMYLIQKLMDEVRYEFNPEGNKLTLVKKRSVE